MKKLSQTGIICLWFLLSGITAVAQSGQIVVQLALETQRYRTGEPIRVRVAIRNETGEALIFRDIISEVNNRSRSGYVEFSVTNAKGDRQLPQLNWISDSFGPAPTEPDWRGLLGNWLVLRPNDCFSSQLSIDGGTFPFLRKAGRYRLAATYSSAGLSYGPGWLGLKEQDVAALPFRSWIGKVESNSIWITIVPDSKSGAK